MLGLHSRGFRHRFHRLVEYYRRVAWSIEEKSKAMAEAFSVGPFDIIQEIPTPAQINACSS